MSADETIDLESEMHFAKISQSTQTDFVIMFFSNRCIFSRLTMPSYVEAASSAPIPFFRATSYKFPHLTQSLGVMGTPTIFRYKCGRRIEYSGDRSVASFLDFAK